MNQELLAEPFEIVGSPQSLKERNASFEYRDNLLAECSQITSIDDSFSQGIASDLASDLAALEKRTEDCRKFVKQPVDDLSRKIQEAARNFIEKVERERKRLNEMIGAFQRSKTEKVMEQVAKAPIGGERMVLPAVSRPKSASFKQEPVWEVQDIQKLYKAHPELVKMEPKAGAIRQKLIDEGCKELPGLKITWTTKTINRT